MATVTFDNVNKIYGDFQAVKDLNLEIGDGEFMVLVGPSGCGKTTSLRMIAGLEEITSGTLRIGDRVVNDVPPKDRDIAMVFQSYALYPHMSVRENLAFGLKLRKVSKAEIERRVNEAAETIQLQKLLDRKPKELSGGQRQRVALGRAIVREPAVFLMDEPLSNLDAKLRVQTRAEIARLHQRLGTTMVYVTHDQIEAMTMGTRIAVMNEGLLQQVGSPQVLYDTPINRFVAGFIGSPSMNFVEVHMDGTGEGARLRRTGRLVDPDPDPLPRSSDAEGRQDARRRVPPRAPRHRRGRTGRGLVPGTRGRRRVPRQRGAAPHQRRRPGHRRDRRIGAPRAAGRHRQSGPAARQAAPVRRRDRPDPRTGHRGRRLSDDPAANDDRGPPGAISSSASSTRGSSIAGRYLTFRVDTIERADGSRGTREIAGHPGAVAILAVDADDRVLLVRQYRVAVGEALLEIPAGTLDVADDGSIEDPDLAAPRELEEETGMRAGSWRRIATLLHRAGVRLGADAPLPRHRPPTGRRRAPGRPTTTSTCSSSACRGARPSRPPSAASSVTARRSSACSGWRGCAREGRRQTRASGRPAPRHAAPGGRGQGGVRASERAHPKVREREAQAPTRASAARRGVSPNGSGRRDRGSYPG